MVSYILLDINILACVCRVQNGIGGYNLLDTNGLAMEEKQQLVPYKMALYCCK